MKSSDDVFFDFELMSIGEVCLGKLANDVVESKSHGYRATPLNGKIYCILFCITEGYLECNAYSGYFLLKGKNVRINQSIQPKDVHLIFPTKLNEWNDGVEHNYIAKVNGMSVEFSWDVRKENPILTYVAIEEE